MAVLAVVGIMVVAGTVILCGTGQEMRNSALQFTPFHVFNTDDVPHEVNVTVFDADATHIHAPVCSEVYRLEADGDVTSSIKNDGSSITNDGREYHFEISVDGKDPEVFAFSIARCHSLAISVRAERDVQALMITSNYAVSIPGITNQ